MTTSDSDSGKQRSYEQRNYPPLPINEALAVAQAIQDKGGGMPVNRLTLAEFVDRSPSSSGFHKLLVASRSYGLTTGGRDATTIGLTDLGERVTSDHLNIATAAKCEAVLNVPPFRKFLEAFEMKKFPAKAAVRDFLTSKAAVPPSRVDECAVVIERNADEVGFIVQTKSGSFIRLSEVARSAKATDNDSIEVQDVIEDEFEIEENGSLEPVSSNGRRQQVLDTVPPTPRHVFIGHGKDLKPLEQLKATLNELGIAYKIAVDEANAGRPIGEKVATIMRDLCSSAIFILSADEQFFISNDQGEMEEIWRPSQNAIYELGAAAVLYGKRIILFKDDKVTLPTDFSDLGHIKFSNGDIGAQWTKLFKELKELGMVEVRVTG
jgi:predicted nucleotide-binding protein